MSGRRGRRFADVGEHPWLRELLPRLGAAPGVVVGPGDDAAVLAPLPRPLVVTTDASIERVHFRPRWASWATLGRRAFRASVSDLSAMGATPRATLLALEVPPRLRVADVSAFVRAFAADARRHGAPLVGGNLARGPHFAATPTILGTLAGRALTRRGACPGDGVFVTGRLGAQAFALRERRAGRTAPLPLPPVRLAVGRALVGVASAMLDVSDGLVQDLGHLCRASGVGARVTLDRLPLAAGCRRLGRRGRLLAATGGEDYELLFTVPAGRERRIADAVGRCPVTRIGSIVRGAGVRLLDAEGSPVPLRRGGGFDHFR